MHYLTVWGQWAVKLPQCTASTHGGNGQRTSCNALPHWRGAVGIGTPAMHHLPALGAVGSATPATHCGTAWGQWAAQLLHCTAPLPRGSRQSKSCNALPDCMGAVGSATPAMQCLPAWGQWTVEFLQCSIPLPGGSEQWNSCNAVPHRPGVVGNGTPAMHCLSALGQ